MADTTPTSKSAEPLVSFVDETTIHGVRDLVLSKRKWEKVLWCSLMLLAMASLITQLYSVVSSYAEDDVATSVESYYPDTLPGLMLCPSLRKVRPEAETGISDDVDAYIDAFTFSRRAMDKLAAHLSRNQSDVAGTVDKAWDLLRSTNNSLSAFYSKYGYKIDDVMEIQGTYPWTPTISGTLLNFYGGGLCYYAQLDEQVYGKLSKLASLIVTLKAPKVQLSRDVPNYLAWFGYRSEFEVVPAARELEVFQGQRITADIRITKRQRYAGRRTLRCRDYDRSENARCILMAGFALANCECNVFEYRQQEALVDDFSCNLFTSKPCLPESSAANAAKVLRDCPEPCVEYDHHVSLDKRNVAGENKTWIWVRMGGVGSALLIRESAAMSLAECLATVGGTLGLYFGVSVLSIAQLGLFAAGVIARSSRYKLR